MRAKRAKSELKKEYTFASEASITVRSSEMTCHTLLYCTAVLSGQTKFQAKRLCTRDLSLCASRASRWEGQASGASYCRAEQRGGSPKGGSPQEGSPTLGEYLWRLGYAWL